MSWLNWLKRLFARFINHESQDAQQVEIVYDDLSQNPDDLSHELEKLNKEIEKFKMENIVFEKLNYLEQYIKVFSTSFPTEYKKYLSLIEHQRELYNQELENYNQGLAGNITFSIDPECESRHYMSAISLEKDITYFMDFVFSYELNKNKFSTLCGKLNTFYNGIISFHVAENKVHKQFTSATNSLQSLISQVQELTFFKQDSRKREEILNLIIYCDYILFKIALRCASCNDLVEYKCRLSQLSGLFISKEYDQLIFKFFVQDLDKIKDFIVSNLQTYESYDFLLQTCNKLLSEMKDFLGVNFSDTYFQDIVKLENTLEEAAKTLNMDFELSMPDTIGEAEEIEDMTVNKTAISVLKLINTDNAKILQQLIESFNIGITWKELYFICKIFEVYDAIIDVAKNTIFSSIGTNFLKLDEKYTDYSSELIFQRKMQLLNYSGDAKKKYIKLFDAQSVDGTFVTTELMRLFLDHVIINGDIYLNYSYFKGFKNLERIFGNYITI